MPACSCLANSSSERSSSTLGSGTGTAVGAGSGLGAALAVGGDGFDGAAAGFASSLTDENSSSMSGDTVSGPSL